MIKATAHTIMFAASATGVTWSAGDVQITKDGAALANTTNLPSELGTTSVYTLALTASEFNCNNFLLHITNGAITTLNLRFETTGEPSGAVVSDAGNGPLNFKTDLSYTETDHVKNALILFTTGTLKDQIRKLNALNTSTGFVTVNESFTTTPASGDLFLVII